MTELTIEQLQAEIEMELGRAARRAWRQLAPDWREAEAEVTLTIAVAAVHKRRPELSAEATLALLQQLGLVVLGQDGQAQVRVPPLADPQPPLIGLQ